MRVVQYMQYMPSAGRAGKSKSEIAHYEASRLEEHGLVQKSESVSQVVETILENVL